MNEAIYVLWRPSFAGSWRSIGEFPSESEAQAYAESKPWEKHGMFTDWEIHPNGTWPAPRDYNRTPITPTYVDGKAVYWTTANVEAVTTLQARLPEGTIINPIFLR